MLLTFTFGYVSTHFMIGKKLMTVLTGSFMKSKLKTFKYSGRTNVTYKSKIKLFHHELVDSQSYSVMQSMRWMSIPMKGNSHIYEVKQWTSSYMECNAINKTQQRESSLFLFLCEFVAFNRVWSFPFIQLASQHRLDVCATTSTFEQFLYELNFCKLQEVS